MEKRIKTLYVLSIIAILTFLGMQVYWLYVRYEYSVKEYGNRTQVVIDETIKDYNKLRVQNSTDVTMVQSTNNLNTEVDSTGVQRRTATVTTKIYNGRELLGAKVGRKLTQEEREKLASIMADGVEPTELRKASFDVSSAPSDGVVWNAMKNFGIEVQSPFSAEGIDSLLRKENIDAAINLTVTDSMMWEAITTIHFSFLNPHFTMMIPYSEIERKAVVIDCKIPSSEVIREMGRTLVMACVLSLFLIACLIWQIKTIAKLTRLDKMRNSFITTMIHELKRPISTLKMCVSGIENDKLMEDDKLRHELTGETRIALDNLSSYFSKLRDITFNNVEQIPLNASSFYLSELVDEVLRSIALPSAKKIAFENTVSEDIEVTADRSHLMNVLTNLIENAIKYSGNEVTVKIGAEITSDSCRITVEDNGNGISAADKDKIFKRFYRGKASATEIPGMGLGLAYVKLLVDAHGGDISVKSTEGAGSTFTIRLPQ